MTIRHATMDDVVAVVDMGLEFFATSSYQQLGEGDPESIATLLGTVLEVGTVLLACDDAGEPIGMIALIVVPHLFSGRTYCDEVAWFVKPGHRGSAGVRLIAEAERWAGQNGAHMLKMVAPEGSDVATLYRRRGYRQLETAYIKDL